VLHARGPARLSVYAVADKFHKRALRTFLDAHPSLEEAGARWFPDDVLYWRWDAAASAALGLPANGGGGECFVFASTGVVAVWGLPSVQYDRAVLALLAPAAASPLDVGEVESDELQFQVSGSEQPSVSNDVITIAAGSLNTTAIKLAISHVRCVHDSQNKACIRQTSQNKATSSGMGLTPHGAAAAAAAAAACMIRGRACRTCSCADNKPSHLPTVRRRWRSPPSWRCTSTASWRM
jgi:hypothetical protein